MLISIGTRLGPYEVVSPLGAGGMGEVWKARDTRLDRSVAIKVLPAEFAENAQLRLRFEREAKTISQLSHPHICTLYDVGDGYLVMELLEGESLADKLTKGPLPLDQVLRYGIEIAEGLDKAHKAGVVHRDLKPGNVMITKSGAKLLDFGLAKMNAALSPQSSVLLTEHKPLTQEGTIVGTFQYMAPEQIEGGEVDARTDIFAFGALLYEMATGRRAFDGKSKASVIASILTVDPQPIRAVQPMTPASFDRIVRLCLEKDPDHRWQSAYDVAAQLRWIADASPEGGAVRAGKRGERIAWTIAGILALVAILAGVIARREIVAQRDAPVIRTNVLPPADATFEFLGLGAPPAIAPNGRKIVFGASKGGKPRTLWVQSLDSLVAQELAATEGATYPFWSPDGRFVAFFADNALKKIEAAGGAPIVICNIADGRGGSWSPDGRTIIFAGRFTPVYRVSASGGTPVEITKLDATISTHRWPEFLPDGKHFLFLSSPSGSEDPRNTICAGSIDGGQARPLVTPAADPHYANGCLLFVRGSTLFAQPFDSKALAVTGEPFVLNEQQVQASALFSKAIVSFASNGTMIYEGGAAARTTQLAWFDRSGKPAGVVGDPATYDMLAVAPDGKSVVASMAPTNQANLWLFDLTRGVKSRLTFNAGVDLAPIWSPDGGSVVYTSFAGGRFRFIRKFLSNASEETVMEGAGVGVPFALSMSPDGKLLMYSIQGRVSRPDIDWMALDDRKPHVYLGSPFVETNARFSPDGKWVAYQSNESGPSDVYVAPFPPTGAKWQVSVGGGLVPRWRRDGRELFYVNGNALYAVPVTMTATPQIGQAVKLFEFRAGSFNGGMYDATADGQRFLINIQTADDPITPIVVVQHFDRELRDTLDHHE